MAGKNIKGLTIEIGGDTTKLGKALDNVNKQSENLSGELGRINKLLKMDPGNADLLAQKQKVLGNAVNDTAKKLEILKEAERQVQEQFERGEVSEAQVRELQREVIATTKQLENYERAAKETADAIDRLGDEAVDAAREVEGFGDKADDAEDESLELGSSLDGTLSAGFTAVIGVATAAAAAIVGCVEASAEYRTAMGKLDTAFTTNNHTSEAAKETYKELQSILGETDQAVEAANHLAKLANTEEELTEWTEVLTGVYATFGDSLPIEGLAEAANESAKTGQVTGALADALNWASLEGETFGLTVKSLSGVTDEWDKQLGEARQKLKQLEAAEKQNTAQVDAARDAVDALKEQISDTKDQLARYKKAVKDNDGPTEEWNAAIAETEKKLEGLQEAEKQAQNELKNRQRASRDAASSIKKEISETKDAMKQMEKGASDAAKPIEDWNEALSEATSAEDLFNLALQECTDEQERQQLITKTLTKLYGKAATQYKKTNKNVIEANKANEDWNETMAEIGDEMAPVVTDIKKFGTEVLKSAKEPLKDVAKFISGTALPALLDLGKWANDNLPAIKAGLAGVAGAMVTYKAATFAAEVAQKGLRGAVLATEAAQKLLNIAQAATPWGLAAVAVGAVTAAVIAYNIEAENAAKATDILTAEERELMAAADEAAQEFRDQKAATQEIVDGITSQMGYITSLKDELLTLADSSGKVQEKDRERVNFILSELNKALDTEYTMTDGIVQKYDELKKNIDAVINSKTANALLEASNADYVLAIQEEDKALQNLVLAEKDYQGQLESSKTKIAEYEAEREELHKKRIEGVGILTDSEQMALYSQINALSSAINDEKNLLETKKQNYDKAASDYSYYSNTIMNYEEAQAAALQGNYDKALDLLKGKSDGYHEHTQEVDKATGAALDALFKEAVDAGVAAQRAKTNFENGVSGYTGEMVAEAAEGYNKAMNAYANAYADAEGVGKDLGDGLKDGMEGKRGALLTKARNLVSGIISAMREAADSNSPSKETMDFGLDMGEGTEIGLEKSTKDILNAARKQVRGILTTYRDEGEEAGPQVLRSVSSRAISRNDQALQTFANSNASKLDKILAAIERGQVLTIDGKALVGATADKTDSSLGQKRALVARGAV